jgi:hypothetical protein
MKLEGKASLGDAFAIVGARHTDTRRSLWRRENPDRSRSADIVSVNSAEEGELLL